PSTRSTSRAWNWRLRRALRFWENVPSSIPLIGPDPHAAANGHQAEVFSGRVLTHKRQRWPESKSKRMESYQLRAFAAVALHQSVTRAAEHLFTSQPAVSAQVKALESTLGVALFSRTSTGMKLTQEGQQLLPRAQAVLAAAQELELQARVLSGSLSATLR